MEGIAGEEKKANQKGGGRRITTGQKEVKETAGTPSGYIRRRREAGETFIPSNTEGEK